MRRPLCNSIKESTLCSGCAVAPEILYAEVNRTLIHPQQISGSNPAFVLYCDELLPFYQAPGPELREVSASQFSASLLISTETLASHVGFEPTPQRVGAAHHSR